jgi:outer membrane protein assembly factor BamB
VVLGGGGFFAWRALGGGDEPTAPPAPATSPATTPTPAPDAPAPAPDPAESPAAGAASFAAGYAEAWTVDAATVLGLADPVWLGHREDAGRNVWVFSGHDTFQPVLAALDAETGERLWQLGVYDRIPELRGADLRCVAGAENSGAVACATALDGGYLLTTTAAGDFGLSKLAEAGLTGWTSLHAVEVVDNDYLLEGMKESGGVVARLSPAGALHVVWEAGLPNVTLGSGWGREFRASSGVVAASSGDFQYAIAWEEGTVLHNPLGEPVWFAAGGDLAVGVQDGDMGYAVDITGYDVAASTGHPTVRVDRGLQGTPGSVADGLVLHCRTPGLPDYPLVLSADTSSLGSLETWNGRFGWQTPVTLSDYLAFCASDRLNENLVLADEQGHVVSLDPRTGAPRWTASFAAAARGIGLTRPTGTFAAGVFLVQELGEQEGDQPTITAFDLATGTRAWELTGFTIAGADNEPGFGIVPRLPEAAIPLLSADGNTITKLIPG